MSPIRRRQFLFAAGAVLAASLGRAQVPAKVPRVGVLLAGSRELGGAYADAFVRAMTDLGYVAGKNIVFEFRYGETSDDRLSRDAAELVRLKVDVILAGNTMSARAAKKATGTLPIVFATTGDPVGSGFVTSLSRPGGNMTGTTVVSNELGAKRVALLKETFPKASRLLIVASTDPAFTKPLKDTLDTAKTLRVETMPVKGQNKEDFARGLDAALKWRPDCMLTLESPHVFYAWKVIADFAAKHRLPVVYDVAEHVVAGGLMSYGPNYAVQYGHAAKYVDKILKGARPADLPIEQPTVFELVINLKTARALRLSVPRSVILRADRVIE